MARSPFLTLGALFLSSAAGAQVALPMTPIDAAQLSSDVKILSSDEFEGRGPATRAEKRTTDFIIARMKAEGLRPAGEHGGWTQDVPLARYQVKSPVDVSFRGHGRVQTLRQSEDIVVDVLRPVDKVAIADAPLVFVGYGVSAPEQGWDDFKNIDLHGKIAVCLSNDPDFEAKPGDDAYGKFGGARLVYKGRWTYKHEEAARRGALGLLIIYEPKPVSFSWETARNSFSNAQFDIVRPDPSTYRPLLQGWVQRDSVVSMFESAGLDFETEKQRARSASFNPIVLSGVTLSAHFDVGHSVITTHNVLGRIQGTSKPGETVLYTAHWDHLGISVPDAHGETINHGAIDNASGIASLLEIARVFKRDGQPRRSIVFMATTAEEKGLLGAEYYADHPLNPLATTVADINIDALRAYGPARDVSMMGYAESGLSDLWAQLAVAQGRRFTPDANPPAGSFYRGDQYQFARVGVPAVGVRSGHDLYQGGISAGEAADREYIDHRYHQPSDRWGEDLDFRGTAIDVGLAYQLGRALAMGRQWPDWEVGSEFKSVRDATASERK